MKKFLKFLWNKFTNSWLISIVLISVIAGFFSWSLSIPNPEIIGFITLFGLGVLISIFLIGRQLWWWITKTGDYEKNKDIKK